MNVDIGTLSIHIAEKEEEARYRELMGLHHYLGDLGRIGHTLWYIATHGDEWVALLGFSASSWKCGVRDEWIGWDFRHQYGRLGLIANNSRFLILPDWHIPNLGSKVLSLIHRRIAADWHERFGKPLLLLETFVDPARFHGTVYRAANWTCLGSTRGFRRTRRGYEESSPKQVFIRPLQRDAQVELSRPVLRPIYQMLKNSAGGPRIMITAELMRTLPGYFADIHDPRRPQGRRHQLHVVLAIAAAATLCGMRGYKAIAGWAKSLGSKARERFHCRIEKRKYIVPSESIIRDVLIRVDPAELDKALRRWNEAFGREDESLAIDGKTMCGAVDSDDRQTHIMSVIGHETALCYAQKKSAPCRAETRSSAPMR